MVYELAQITVAPAQRDQFIDVYKAAWRKAALAGAHAATIMRCVEDPSRVAVLIAWDDVESHQGHKGTPAMSEFRATIHAYVQTHLVQHYSFERIDAHLGEAGQ